MKCFAYLLFVSVMLAMKSHAAPWDDENEMNENDLEWQCNTLCASCNAIPIYQPDTSMCYCNIDPGEETDIDWKRIKKNAKYLGLIVELLTTKPKNITKREIETKEIKKEEIENTLTKNENKVPLHERLRLSLLTKKQLRQQAVPKSAPIATNPIVVAKAAKAAITKQSIAKIPDRRELLRKRIQDRIDALRLRSLHKIKAGEILVGNPKIPVDKNAESKVIVQPMDLIG